MPVNKISVLVPLYRVPKFFATIARTLAADPYPEKEIVAVVDGELTPEIQEAFSSLSCAFRVIHPGAHWGKAKALNHAVAGLETDVLLFLDNDIELPENPKFLSILASKMEHADIVDLPKEVIVESFYSSMISFEYQSLAMASLAFASLAGRSPALIGAAFAVRKNLFDRLEGFRAVVHEDGDFGARAFRLRARYVYCLPLKVRTSMPNSLKEWFVQRKRWTVINVLWFKDTFLHLMLSVLRQPSLLPSLLVLILPSVLSLLLYLGLNTLNLSFLNPVLLMVEQPFQVVAGVILWFSHHKLLTDGLLGIALGFGTTLAMYFAFTRVARFRFNPAAFTVYYFAYMPLLVGFQLTMFVSLLVRRRVHLDWKT